LKKIEMPKKIEEDQIILDEPLEGFFGVAQKSNF
jgi:hypothetical protein